MLHRRIATLLAAVLLLAVLCPARAYETKTATLHYNGISIMLDGEYLTPQDVTGAAVNPFIIDGTTYLPIRAVASALGLEVGWEQETQTITLTSGGEANLGPGIPNADDPYTAEAELKYPGITIYLDGEKLIPKDVTGKVVDPFVIGGTTYLPIRAIASALGLTVDWNGETKTVLLYTTAPEKPEEPETPEEPADTALLGTLGEGVYTNPAFGFRFTAPEGWLLVDADTFAEAKAELAAENAASMVLAAADMLDSAMLMVGVMAHPDTYPEDQTEFYNAILTEFQDDETGPLAALQGEENLNVDIGIGTFAGQEAGIILLSYPMVYEDVDLGITLTAAYIFIRNGQDLLALQLMTDSLEGMEALLGAFEPIG